jgi:hypothetical protein
MNKMVEMFDRSEYNTMLEILIILYFIEIIFLYIFNIIFLFQALVYL